MSYKISIIHPSSNRPELAFKTFNKWKNKADNLNDIEYILSLDEDEKMIEQYNLHFSRRPSVSVVQHVNRSAIDAINNAAKYHTTGNLLIVVSDDFDCPEHWDTLLLKCLEGKKDYIVKTKDGLQPWIITLPIMDRKYYERFGYIYYPGYQHMFCDTEMTHVADLLDRKVELYILFSHLHPDAGLSQRDALNDRNNRTWAQGEALYIERMRNNFGLTDCPGKLCCPPAHIIFFKQKGIDILNLQ